MKRIWKIFKNPLFWTVITLIAFIYVLILSCFYDDNLLLGGTQNLPNGWYESFRILTLNHQFDNSIILNQKGIIFAIAIVILLFVFLYISNAAFIELLFPRIRKMLHIKLRFRNHIIICGYNEIGVELIKRYKSKNKKIILLVDVITPQIKSLQSSRCQIIEGYPVDINELDIAKIWDATKIEKAEIFFAVTKEDNKNVEIAQSIWWYLTKLRNPEFNKKAKKCTKPLKCYTLVQDSELKSAIENTPIFKYKPKDNENYYFDGVIFDFKESGIRYGICEQIAQIIPAKHETKPQILLLGLTKITENVLLSLAHCLTMDRQKFHFTIVEENETLTRNFKEKYDYLTDFAEIEYKKQIIKKELKKSNFTSIFICHTDKIEAVKQAVSVRYALHQESPNIFIFSNNSEKLNNIFNPYPDTETEPSMFRFEKGNNIFIFNPLASFVEYIVEKNREVEAMAEMAHEEWGGHIKYFALSEHYKQSNRNQVLDNKIRIYLATGYKLYSPELQQFVSERNYTELFSSYAKETLAIIEHRRWMIEKHIDGWTYGEKKNPKYKISPYLKDWNDIPPDIKTIDYKAIDLMIDIIKGKTNETAL